MSRFHNGQLCFSISCCHRGPNTFFRISGSLTPIRRLPVAGAEDSFGVLNGVAWLRLWSQDHECCNQIFMAAPRDGCGNLFLKSPCLTNHKAFTPILLDGAAVVRVGILAAVFRSHLTRQMVVQADAHRTVLSKDGGPCGGLPFPAAQPEAAFSLTQTVGEP